MGENDSSNSQILMVIGQVCLRQKDFDRALQSMHTAIEVIEQNDGGQSEQIGSCYLELSQAYLKLKMISEALEYQSKAYQTYNQIEQFSNSDFLAGILITMAEM